MVEALLWAVAVGTALGILYDVLRFVRLLFNSRFFIDFLFWILAGLVIFSYLLVFNNGEVRSQYLFAVAFGFGAYVLTMGRLTLIPQKALAKKYRKYLRRVKNRLKKCKKVLQLPRTLYYNIKVLKRNPFKKGFWRDEDDEGS